MKDALTCWQNEPDLAGIRMPDELEKLPPSERQECLELWSDVVALIKRAQDAK